MAETLFDLEPLPEGTRTCSRCRVRAAAYDTLDLCCQCFAGVRRGYRMDTPPAVCDLCGKPETARSRGVRPKRLSRDHDHRTGSDRGWLCHRCNLVIGFADDDPQLLRRAVEYLAAW